MSSPEAEAPPEEDAAPARDEAREELLGVFTDALGDAVLEHHIKPGDDLWIRVTPEAWTTAGETARYAGRCNFFDFLSAIDWLPSPFGRDMDSEIDTLVHGTEPKDPGEMQHGYAGGETRFQVFARVAPVAPRPGVTLKVDVPEDTLTLDSWVPVYVGATWHERETWEMYGVTFAGHPYLRHIYLPGEFEGFPCRKDFPLLARKVKPWPGIVDVEPLPGGDDEGDGEGEA